MKNKLILMTVFASAMLIGMEDNGKQLQIMHSSGLYRAQTVIPESFRKSFAKLFGGKTAYPIFVVSVQSNLIQEWFHFDYPIKSMGWDRYGEYALYVTTQYKTHLIDLTDLRHNHNQKPAELHLYLEQD